MRTYIHEEGDGAKVEYRRFPYDRMILHLQARPLRRDGNPQDERWHAVSDAELLHLQMDGSDIVDLACAEME
jgi:hypothetical protein